ncbi:hypothetical protein V1503_24845 [Bacillus sp. SCS-151]|uniref:hypothetical protein n=1 Tax=Nanhaiella sioensis TaxID=3115293 RepID=UPI00397C3940
MILNGRIEEFKHYSNFKNLKEFNNHIEMFLAIHKKEFTKSEFIAFNRLRKYCAKVIGVANASKRKILEAIQGKDTEPGVSESTFHRMRRKAEDLGILKIEPTHRRDESRSTNLWIFNRFVAESTTIDTPRTDGELEETAPNQQEVVNQLTPHKTNLSFKASNLSIKHLMPGVFNYIKYVPKLVNEKYAGIFQHDLKELWDRVNLACKNAERTFSGVRISKTDKNEIGLIAIDSLYRYMIQRHQRNGFMDLEEQCKIVYSVTFNQIEQQYVCQDPILEGINKEKLLNDEKHSLIAKMLE